MTKKRKKIIFWQKFKTQIVPNSKTPMVTTLQNPNSDQIQFLTKSCLVGTWHLNKRWDVLGQPFAISQCFVLFFTNKCITYIRKPDEVAPKVAYPPQWNSTKRTQLGNTRQGRPHWYRPSTDNFTPLSEEKKIKN